MVVFIIWIVFSCLELQSHKKVCKNKYFYSVLVPSDSLIKKWMAVKIILKYYLEQK